MADHHAIDVGVLSRAQGCLLGQLAGDSLGSLVEFQEATTIRRLHPAGLRDLANGGTWGTLAGQPTDDSELALALARTLVEEGFDLDAIHRSYVEWLDSGPFDVGNATRQGIQGRPDAATQANGSVMRVSPLGIFGHALPPIELAEMARADSAITHPHAVCRDASATFTVAIAHAIRTGDGPAETYEAARRWAHRAGAHPDVVQTLEAASREPPAEYQQHMGWVRIALHNAFYRLLHATTLEDGVVNTVMEGGDTDTNAAIAGALLGAVHGRDAVPLRWRQAILSCRPIPPAHRPRPERYWPADALELAELLLLAGRNRRTGGQHERQAEQRADDTTGGCMRALHQANMSDSIDSTAPELLATPGDTIPAATATLDEVCTFAHAVDGYQLAGSFERCAAIHASVRERFDAGLPLEAESDELRCALFFAHRAARHSGYPLDSGGVAFVRTLVEEIRALATGQDSDAPSLDTNYSNFREKMLEHVFVSQLLQEAWFRYGRTMEVLRAEVDSSGYDLVLEFDGVLRHVQLKSSRADAKTARQNLSTKLAEKPSGCVVWITYREDPSRARVGLKFRFFGGVPGAPLPALGDTVAKHSKGDAHGVKKERPGLRTVSINRFSDDLDLQQLFRRLFIDEGWI